jgi:hypothetical protein
MAVLLDTVCGRYAYDNLNRRTQLAASVASTADFKTTYAYDSLSRITKITRRRLHCRGRSVVERPEPQVKGVTPGHTHPMRNRKCAGFIPALGSGADRRSGDPIDSRRLRLTRGISVASVRTIMGFYLNECPHHRRSGAVGEKGRFHCTALSAQRAGSDAVPPLQSVCQWVDGPGERWA